jgi:peptidyl-prolyl cis-trans isomerase B (cyclophilin B)
MIGMRWIAWGCALWMSAAVSGCGNATEGDTGAAASTSQQQQPVTAALPTSLTSGEIHSPAPSSEDQGDPIVAIHTSLGKLYVRLYEQQAPRTVANFLDYARGQHYDGTIFHRVDSGYVAMVGEYDAQLRPKQVRYPITNEATNGLKNVRGALAMARDPRDPNSASAQFFINLADNRQLDHHGSTPEAFGFCVFGQVIDGLDVLDKLGKVETATIKGFDKMPVETVMLNTIRPVR